MTYAVEVLTVRNLKSYRNPIPFFRGNVELGGRLVFWGPICEFTFSDWLKVKGEKSFKPAWLENVPFADGLPIENGWSFTAKQVYPKVGLTV